MPWHREQSRLGCELDDAAQVHHAHVIADMAHHGEVVGDKQVGQPLATLQILHQVEHLRLHRDVEGRRRLVAHQEFRFGGERSRDRDPLALATGELMRVLLDIGGRKAHRAEQFGDPLLQRRRGPAESDATG
jgi:hypothetical protein